MSKSFFKSFNFKQNDMLMYLAMFVVIIFVLRFTFTKRSKPCNCPTGPSKIVVPLGNGQSVALTREQFQYLRENDSGEPKREGFYVSSQDYIPPVATEAEYSSMLSLYKPKEPTRVIPEPTPTPMPAPMPAPVEPYGNIFVDNIIVPRENEEDVKMRMKLAEMGPFFLNNGQLI